MAVCESINKNEAFDLLVSSGVPENHARIVADCFATADAYGVTSHGCGILPAHLDRIRRGGYNLRPQFRILRHTAAFAVIDGDNAMGPVSAMFCMDHAIAKSRESGVFTVFSPNNNTFGPAFYYSLKAAEKGCIALICSNSPAQMAPVGGAEKLLGTNPFAVVIPVPGEDPIIIDMATSVVAKSKFKEYKQAGKPLPEGWALDIHGQPTTDPDEAMAGFVLPMAGFKGYAISMLIDIVSGVLSGAAWLDKVGRFYSQTGDSMNVGFCMTVMDPTVVCGDEFEGQIKEFVQRIRSAKPAGGASVVLPGADRMKIYHSNRETI